MAHAGHKQQTLKNNGRNIEKRKTLRATKFTLRSKWHPNATSNYALCQSFVWTASHAISNGSIGHSLYFLPFKRVSHVALNGLLIRPFPRLVSLNFFHVILSSRSHCCLSTTTYFKLEFWLRRSLNPRLLVCRMCKNMKEVKFQFWSWKFLV